MYKNMHPSTAACTPRFCPGQQPALLVCQRLVRRHHRPEACPCPRGHPAPSCCATQAPLPARDIASAGKGQLQSLAAAHLIVVVFLVLVLFVLVLVLVLALFIVIIGDGLSSEPEDGVRDELHQTGQCNAYTKQSNVQ